MNTYETRSTNSNPDTQNNKISGYAALFYKEGRSETEYKLFDNAVERIDPSAFNRALSDEHDCIACFNHDEQYLLGRTTSGTLRLSVDKIGLRYDIDYNEADPLAKSVYERIKRGDITGSSFKFGIIKEEWRTEGKTEVRYIKEVYLADVGPVIFPAYKGTTTGIRDAKYSDESKKSFDNWIETKKRMQIFDERYSK